MKKICEKCDEEFFKRKKESQPRFEKRRFCSIPCRLNWQRDWYKNDNPMKYFDNSGKNNPMFGKTPKHFNPDGNMRKDGYFRITVDGIRMLKHRHIVEKHIGRKLLKTEVVHHKDGDNTNNSIENLEVLRSQAEHASLHSSIEGGII